MIRLVFVLLCAVSLFAALPTSTSAVASGTSENTTFTITFTDTDGGSQITAMYVAISSTTWFPHTSQCYVSTVVSANQMYLANDAGTDITPLTPGDHTSYENSQCKLHALNSSFSVVGNTVTLVLRVSFFSAFYHATPKRILAWVSSSDGGAADVVDLGGFTVGAAAGTYYIDATAGDDDDDGTDTARPWKTLTEARSWVYTPGDRILLKRGERFRDYFDGDGSGASGNPITFAPYGSGAAPIIDGSEVVTGWSGTGPVYYKEGWSFASNAVFQNDTALTRGSNATLSAGQYWYESATGRLHVRMTDSSDPATKTVEATKFGPQGLGIWRLNGDAYWVLQGIDFRKSNYFGVVVENGSDNVKVQYNTFSRTYQNAIEARGQQALANSSNIHALYNTFDATGIARGYMQTTEAEACNISFVGVQTGSIIGNVSTSGGGDGIQFLAGSTNLTVTHNVIINQYSIGIYPSAGWGNGGHVTNNVVAYNTVYMGAWQIFEGMAIATEYQISTFTVNEPGDTVTSTYDAEYEDNYPVSFIANGGTLPAPLVEGTIYYVRQLAGTTFELSETAGGAKLPLTSAGSGSARQVKIAHRIDGLNFHHNVVYGTGTGDTCYAFGNGLNVGGTLRNVKFHHNVCSNAGFGVVAMGPTDDTSNVFSNNILSVVGASGRAYAFAANAGVPNVVGNYPSVNYDIVHAPDSSTVVTLYGSSYNLANWIASSVHADNSISADPLLTDPSSGDVRLQAGSPAINAGVVVSGVEQARTGSFPDMGALEYTTGKLTSLNNTKLRNRYRATVN